MIFEGYQQTYGVGMPIMLTFSTPITNKAAVERSLELTTSKPVIGAWYWDGDEHLYFRPRDYWPANTTVSFDGHLNGVEGAKGVYATANLTQSFNIGRSLIAVASTTTHRTQIYLNGKLAYQWPISTGRASLPTPDGTYVSVEKANPVRMIGGGAPGSAGYYNELVNYAVRFTFSGDYYHSAPWSVVNQGTSNVSHGCVNLPPSAAVTYYNMSIPGDPITVTNSTAAGKWDDGWTEWFLPWSQYLHGSALGQAVMAGPQGSTFVSPSSLPADTATAPLETSASGNYYAGAATPGVARPRGLGGCGFRRPAGSGGFPEGGDALAHADAHAGRAAGDAAPPHLVQQGGHDPRAGAAERMPDGDRAAVDVDPVRVGLELVHDRHRLRRERLVDLDQVHLVQLPAPGPGPGSWRAPARSPCSPGARRPPRRPRSGPGASRRPGVPRPPT